MKKFNEWLNQHGKNEAVNPGGVVTLQIEFNPANNQMTLHQPSGAFNELRFDNPNSWKVIQAAIRPYMNQQGV